MIISGAGLSAEEVKPHNEHSYFFEVPYSVVKVEYYSFGWPFRHILGSDFNSAFCCAFTPKQQNAF
jgi:hypothetical protein